MQAVRHLWEAEKMGPGETVADKKEFPMLSLRAAIEAFTEAAYDELLTSRVRNASESCQCLCFLASDDALWGVGPYGRSHYGNQRLVVLRYTANLTCYDRFVMYNVRNLASAFKFGILAALASDRYQF